MKYLNFTVGLYIDYDIINYFGEDRSPPILLKNHSRELYETFS